MPNYADNAPTFERIRDMYTWAYAWRTQDGEDDTDLSQLRAANRAEFDRAMKLHDNEMRAEGVEAFAATWSDDPSDADEYEVRQHALKFAAQLRARAAEIRKTGNA